jgi:FkbH-like protein
MKIAFLTSYNSALFNKNFEESISKNNSNLLTWWNLFGTLEQQVFDKSSSLYLFEPDIILLHLEVEWLLGDFGYDILSVDESTRHVKLEEVKSKIVSLVNTLDGYLPLAKLVIENFALRNRPLLGILDSNIKLGLYQLTTELNIFLFSLIKQFNGKLLIHNYAELISDNGRENCFDSRLFKLAKNPYAKAFHEKLFQHYYSIIDLHNNPRKKCIVVDLDNTLWGGIAGQSDTENIELGGEGLGEAYVQFQKALLNYYRKGFLLAACSKNNFDDSIEIIEKHPDMILRKEHFAQLKINWLDKTSNIKSIAEDLNIDTGSIVFLDDDPAECELIKQQLPGIEVINLTGDPDNYIKQLLAIISLNTASLTKEDFSRNKMLNENILRKNHKHNSIDLFDYYKSLDMQAFVSINNISHASRAAQLTQKTNQFNLTSKHFTTEDIKNIILQGNYRIYSLRLIDKFGDNGIVLAAIIKLDGKEWYIDNLVMSCRVIGRQAETALLNVILQNAIEANVEKIRGSFILTKKNAPAEDFFKKHGFYNLSDTEWQITLPAKLNPHFINIVLE